MPPLAMASVSSACWRAENAISPRWIAHAPLHATKQRSAAKPSAVEALYGRVLPVVNGKPLRANWDEALASQQAAPHEHPPPPLHGAAQPHWRASSAAASAAPDPHGHALGTLAAVVAIQLGAESDGGVSAALLAARE